MGTVVSIDELKEMLKDALEQQKKYGYKYYCTTCEMGTNDCVCFCDCEE